MRVQIYCLSSHPLLARDFAADALAGLGLFDEPLAVPDDAPGVQLIRRVQFKRLRLPSVVEAFQAPPRGPGTPFLFKAAAMSRGELPLSTASSSEVLDSRRLFLADAFDEEA
ncbi:hypothetical protein [Bradyrhizobium sp. USDA 329]|uniref:hypothetical protein n=1 Tax=unclassified Bradyrhizobium TaxID=2631580 RepID=UPI003517288A